jgi:hypothetical protein
MFTTQECMWTQSLIIFNWVLLICVYASKTPLRMIVIMFIDDGLTYNDNNTQQKMIRLITWDKVQHYHHYCRHLCLSLHSHRSYLAKVMDDQALYINLYWNNLILTMLTQCTLHNEHFDKSKYSSQTLINWWSSWRVFLICVGCWLSHVCSNL